MSDGQAATETPEELDRAAMFAAGPPGIPRRTIWIALAVAAVLGIGGAFADHSFNVQPTAPPTPVTHNATAQHETLAQFVGLKPLDDKTAPPIDLTDGFGRLFTLSQVVGRPVILTFLGPTCKESCPVVTLEIAEAETTLAKDHLRPAVVIVNADPQHLSVASAHAALEHRPLAELSGATFVTGSLTEIEPIWKTYGVTIEDDPTTGALAYTNVLFLLDSTGRLQDSLTSFADESFSGTATLPTPEIDRFASGIVTYLEQAAR